MLPIALSQNDSRGCALATSANPPIVSADAAAMPVATGACGCAGLCTVLYIPMRLTGSAALITASPRSPLCLALRTTEPSQMGELVGERRGSALARAGKDAA